LKYFENFKEMIVNISEMADETHKLFSAEVPEINIARQVSWLTD